ncbi:MAG: exonuclease domain-containing protein [Christensenellales bacterium]
MGFVAVDVETASSRSQGYICSIGICVIREGRIVEEFYTLCHPALVMDPFCQNIHGITDEMVEGAPTTYEMLVEGSAVFRRPDSGGSAQRSV